MFSSAGVCVGAGGPHVRNNDSYTPLQENKHLKRAIDPPAGKFYKPDCSTFIHPLSAAFFSLFFPCLGLEGGPALPRIL